jgi:hypothetical protein
LHEQAEQRKELEREGRHEEAEEVKPKVGFAAMDKEKVQEIARKGAETRHQQAEQRHQEQQQQK